MILLEGHSDTRARWSGNFTTFSDAERLETEPPYVEVMLKADGEQLELRLRQYIRGRGYDDWLSVATSPKGSYREEDVLNFLDRHLPAWGPGRGWRLMLADAFAAHDTENVKRLAWSRGYVFMLIGGGATSVAQTCDTDLNQHVRREYTALEGKELVALCAAGQTVPKVSYETTLDMMAAVMSHRELHRAA